VASASELRVVVVATGNAELVRQVRAEASELGLQTESVADTPPRSDDDWLARPGAVAVVRLVSVDRVAIHVSATGSRSAYDTTLERAGSDGAAFAVRIVELVRGRLVELNLLPSDPERPPALAAASATATAGDRSAGKEAPPPPSVAAARGPMVWVSAGSGGALASGGLGPTLELALGFRVEPSERWWVAPLALFPATENVVSGPEGSAGVLVEAFIVELGYRFWRPSEHWQLEAGPGVGLAVLTFDADAVAPLEGGSETMRTGLFFAHAGLSATIAPWLCLRPSLAAGTSAPRPVARFAGREVGTWGHAFGMATLTADLGWPLTGRASQP